MTTEAPMTVAPAEAPALVVPEPAAPQSRAWLGVLAGFVVLALLVGANAVLFMRVQAAQDQADEAVTLAGGNQAQLQAQFDEIDATLADIQKGQTDASDDVAALTTQLTAMKKCVNNALDGFSQATQTGKPVAITKC